MQAYEKEKDLECLFPGDSKMAKLMQSFDWSDTDLLSPEEWPEELRQSVKLCLTSGIPIVIFWGPNFTLLYNDAYISLLGKKHPRSLGRPCIECWPEAWPLFQEMHGIVCATKKATWSEDLQVCISRALLLEETFLRFTFGPIMGKDGHTIQGIFCPCTETTEQVISSRRLETLRQLSFQTVDSKNTTRVCEHAIEVMKQNPEDITFAALYIMDQTTPQATLITSKELAHLSLFPETILLSKDSKIDHQFPLARAMISVLHEKNSKTISNLCAMGLNLPGGKWPEPTNQAVILQIAAVGILILGLSPRQVLNEAYYSFLNLIAVHISTAFTNAKLYEAEHSRAKALTELHLEKTRFFNNISHEFRTSITLILGPLDEALKKSHPLLDGKNLTLVRRNALRLLKLVNTLLDCSRIEAGRMQAHFELIPLSKFTTELASNFRSAITNAGLKFKVNCDRKLEAYVDREMWEKIILNLLSNALKFTFEGEIEVKLQSTVENRIELSVKDTGTGIPTHELPRIFKHFYQVKGSKGRSYEGSGIGLALVQDLVHLHGGKIKVQSVLGKGTTFFIYLQKGSTHLPQDKIFKQENNSLYSTQSEPFVTEALHWFPENKLLSDGINASPQNNFRILIADDNTDMCKYLSELLGEHWLVQTVNNGQAALDLIHGQNQTFDLVLSDVMMPGMDGFQLLRGLKSDPNTDQIPVILISALAKEESRIEALQAGADDYIIKPFLAKELTARIKTQLELSKPRNILLSKLNILTRLHTIATQFVQEGEVYDILLEVLDTSISITNAAKATIQIVDEDSKSLKLIASRGFSQLFKDRFAMRSNGIGIGNIAWQKGERIIVEDITESPLLVGTVDLQLLLGEGIRSIQATPLKNSSGKILGVLKTHYSALCVPEFRDIQLLDLLARLTTEIIENGQWIQERTKWVEKLCEADRRKDNFLAMLSHELRNPLAVISNSSFMLSHSPAGSETALGAQATIGRQLKQINNLVDDLLDMTRITKNKIQLRCERININELIHRAIEDNRPLFQSLELGLQAILSPIPVIIHADPTRIAQVLGNLLQNASKFSLPGGLTQVSVEAHENFAVIRVVDNGIGIPPALCKDLFEPFMQADCSMDRSQGGLGLGLSLVKGLIELHGGSVFLNSEGAGKGTEFTIKLPLATIKNQNTSAFEEPEIKGKITHTVLIIDDNIAAADSLGMVIKLFGHTIHLAYSGPDGIQKAQEIKPDVILCDIGLPGMDGYQVAKTLKSNETLNSTHLIALSGYAQPDDIKKSIIAGFDRHLAKPPNLANLKQILLEVH